MHTFTDIYRGSQPTTFAPVCAYYGLIADKTDTILPTVIYRLVFLTLVNLAGSYVFHLEQISLE